MSFFDTIFSAVKAVVGSFADQVRKFAYAFLPKLGDKVQVAIEDVLEVAAQAVLEQAPKVLDGSVKFSNAVEVVVNTVESSGKKIAIQTAQAAVQLAYLEAQKIAQGK